MYYNKKLPIAYCATGVFSPHRGLFSFQGKMVSDHRNELAICGFSFQIAHGVAQGKRMKP